MKSKIFINLLSVIFFTGMLFVAFPIMAQEPTKETQSAVKGINADDAEDIDYQNLQQEVKELKQEVQKLRNENEARKKLEVPEEEKGKSVEDILSAAGRQYTLLKKGTIGLGYTFSYSYYSGNVIDEAAVPLIVERRSNHNITNTIDTQYALTDYLTVNANIPFAYKYDKVGTSSALESTDLGDTSIGLQVQPFKSGGKFPTTILSAGVNFPTGSSPYKIDSSHSLATGNGYYSFSGGASFSKTMDPLVAFGNLNYTYGLEQGGLSYQVAGGVLEKVEPGSSVGFSLGFGYALSYQASLNLSAQYSYSFGSTYTFSNGEKIGSGSSTSSSFNIGTGWRISPTRSIYLSLGIGLTISDPDFSFSARVPFEF